MQLSGGIKNPVDSPVHQRDANVSYGNSRKETSGIATCLFSEADKLTVVIPPNCKSVTLV